MTRRCKEGVTRCQEGGTRCQEGVRIVIICVSKSVTGC